MNGKRQVRVEPELKFRPNLNFIKKGDIEMNSELRAQILKRLREIADNTEDVVTKEELDNVIATIIEES